MNTQIAEVQDATRRAIANVATPSDLLRMAVEQGADLDRLERLMELQERWEAGQARKAYDEAFTAFKAEAVKIIKNRTVTDGPLKNKSYAELFAVVNAITPALSKHGLSSSWKITRDDKEWIEVTCTLKHFGGHTEAVAMGGPPDVGGSKNAIQARGSTVSYLERYTLKAITGLSEQGDDADGGGGRDVRRDAFDTTDWRIKIDDCTTKAELDVVGEELKNAKGIPGPAMTELRRCWGQKARLIK